MKACPTKEHFVSKYYLASPPVKDKEKFILGQLVPDQLSFRDGNPEQVVGMTYTVLPAVGLEEIGTDFDYKALPIMASCEEQNVNLVPINIVCNGFPRNDGGIGASGIGYLENQLGYNSIFVPRTGPNKEDVLDCTATILDDIILEHQVYFHDGESFSKAVNMRDLYYQSEPMKFVCVERRPDDIPTGCRAPE